MHCCNWAVLSSITLVSVSSRRPRKALSEADSRGAPLAPGVRSYIVAERVTKSPLLLSPAQTQSPATIPTHGEQKRRSRGSPPRGGQNENVRGQACRTT